jgi:hypothetical protein
LTHYDGWPISTGISGAAETVLRRRAAAAQEPGAPEQG